MSQTAGAKEALDLGQAAPAIPAGRVGLTLVPPLRRSNLSGKNFAFRRWADISVNGTYPKVRSQKFPIRLC